MGRVRISSPDANVSGWAYLTVTTGKPLIILVNGHWNKILNKIGAAPKEGKEGYWNYFLEDDLETFIENAKTFFKDTDYQEDPYYIDGSTLYGGDESGGERKIRGYQYALKNFKEITQNIGDKKVYIISHSEGCAFAAGVARYLMEKGVQVGESLMLAADEGDEFSVEGNYPCYQLVLGWPSFYIKRPGFIKRTKFTVDIIVGDHMVRGVDKYGVFIVQKGSWDTVHGGIVSKDIFSIITQLKSVMLRKMFGKDGSIFYLADPDPDQVWYKINETVVHNKRINAINS